MIGWDFISPFPDGTFSITVKQYTGATPGAAGATANGPYGYGFGALLLAEVEVAAPAITVNPPAVTTVEQNRPIRLSVTATGTPLLYQWYKQGVGAIAGATSIGTTTLTLTPTLTLSLVRVSSTTSSCLFCLLRYPRGGRGRAAMP